MKKQFMAFAFGILTTASVFIFTAFVGKYKTIELNNSKAIFMGGKFNNFQQTLNLVEGNKNHTLKIGDQFIKHYTFDKDLISDILQGNESQAIRVYYGYDEKTQQKNLILTSVNKDGLDIEKSGLITGIGPCPSHCPKAELKQTFSKVMF